MEKKCKEMCKEMFSRVFYLSGLAGDVLGKVRNFILLGAKYGFKDDGAVYLSLPALHLSIQGLRKELQELDEALSELVKGANNEEQ